MRDVYNIEIWWVYTPWVLLVVALIAVAKLWHLAGVLNNSNSLAQKASKEKGEDLGNLVEAIQEFKSGRAFPLSEASHERLYKSLQLLKQWKREFSESESKRDKAEANARESAAAHREAVRLLQVAEAELAKYRPSRDKKGLFIPKKKVSIPLAKKKAKG